MDAPANDFQAREIVLRLRPSEQGAKIGDEITICDMRRELTETESEGGAIISVERQEIAPLAASRRVYEIGPETIFADIVGMIKVELLQARTRKDVIQANIIFIGNLATNEKGTSVICRT